MEQAGCSPPEHAIDPHADERPGSVHAQEGGYGAGRFSGCFKKWNAEASFSFGNPMVPPGCPVVMRAILAEFLEMPGVTAAAIVGCDGFVIEGVADGVPDYDALGAFSSDAFNYFNRAGRSSGSGGIRQLMAEYHDGAMILTPLTAHEFLVILTDTTRSLGHLNIIIPGFTPRIAAAM